MLVLALVFAGLAALVHVFIFWIESLAFTTTGRQLFRVSADDAALMQPWAFNQGFYNLFLAIGTAAGVLLAGSHREVGLSLVVFGTASMLGAAVVLVSSDRSRAQGALVQGMFPLLCLLDLLVYALT